MKFYALIAAMLLSGSIAFAHTDPIVMIIDGQSVKKSEFEYSYQKNHLGNTVMRMLSDAIKGVYASVYYRDSKAYMQATSNVIDQDVYKRQRYLSFDFP